MENCLSQLIEFLIIDGVVTRSWSHLADLSVSCLSCLELHDTVLNVTPPRRTTIVDDAAKREFIRFLWFGTNNTEFSMMNAEGGSPI